MAKTKRRGKKEKRGREARRKEKEEERKEEKEIQKGKDDGGEVGSKGIGDIRSEREGSEVREISHEIGHSKFS